MSDWLEQEEMDKILREELAKNRKGEENGENDLNKESVEIKKVQFEPFAKGQEEQDPFDLKLLYDVPLNVSVRIGSTNMSIEELLKLKVGSIVKLDKLAGELVDVYVEGELIARGETIMVQDRFGVLINEIVPPKERLSKSIGAKLVRQNS